MTGPACLWCWEEHQLAGLGLVDDDQVPCDEDQEDGLAPTPDQLADLEAELERRLPGLRSKPPGWVAAIAETVPEFVADIRRIADELHADEVIREAVGDEPGDNDPPF